MYAIYFPEQDYYLPSRGSAIKVFKTYEWAQDRISRFYKPDKAIVVKVKIVQDETIGVNELRS